MATDSPQRSIQSIETGFALLAALVDSSAPLTLRDLSRAAGMTSAKAHPYLVSFIRVGLVRQDGASGRYELGPFSLQLGVAGLQRLDPVRAALPAITQLADNIGHTTALAVLGSHGPTMIHVVDARYPVHVNMRPGTVMSMLHTATGHIFSAWLPPTLARHYIEREAQDGAVVTARRQPPIEQTALDALLDGVRTHGMARALGNPLPGIDALSVPVFDHANGLALAITTLGPSGLFDASWDGPVAKALRACAHDISATLGHTPQS